MRIAVLAALGVLSGSGVAASAPSTVALPACPAATRDLWLHKGVGQYSLGGRIWTLPQIAFVRPPQNDKPGGAIDIAFRIRQGAIFTSAAGWDPNHYNSDPLIEIHIRSLGSDSPPGDTKLAAEIRSSADGPTDLIALWGLKVDATYGVLNRIIYHALNGNLPILMVCQGRFPDYNGPFFPACEGFQAVYPHAAMEYRFSANYLIDVPRIVSCINTMIDDLSKPTNG